MAEQLSADSLALLLSIAKDDPDVMVRISTLDAAAQFPLNRAGWQSVAEANWRIVRSEPEGSIARRAALELAVRIPLRSLRIHLRNMADDPQETDRDTIAAALDAAGDPSRVQQLLHRAVTDGGASYGFLAAMPVEAAITSADVPPGQRLGVLRASPSG